MGHMQSIRSAAWIAATTVTLFLCCSCRFGRAEYQASRGAIKTVSASQLRDWMTGNRRPTLIDVREDNEWQAGHAAAALHIPRWRLHDNIGAVVPEKAARIVLYCRSGVRSASAAATLQDMGYTNVYSLDGGFKNYQLAGLPAGK
jgi:phage shock protein E